MVGDATPFLGHPAMAQKAGNGVYFSATLNSTRSLQGLAATLLHESTHRLGFSEG